MARTKTTNTGANVSSPRTNGTQYDEIDEKIEKGREVIHALQEGIRYGDYNADQIEQLYGKLLDDVLSGEAGNKFTPEAFLHYHPLIFHDEAKSKFKKYFFDFISDCIHIKNGVKPIEAIKHDAFLKGIECFLVALGEDKVIRYKTDQTDFMGEKILLTQNQKAMNALADLYLFRFALFNPYKDIIDKYQNSTTTSQIKANFMQKISLLAELYQIDLNKQEKKDMSLAGKIADYFGIKSKQTE